MNLKWVNERPVLTTKRDYGGPSLVSDRDYESLVLTKMRQAAERQRLIEEMMKEEKDKWYQYAKWTMLYCKIKHVIAIYKMWIFYYEIFWFN